MLAPLRLRFHPAGSSVVVEWGSDEDPGAALYVTSGGVAPGAELTVISDERSNEGLLLYGYYIWDEMAAARPTLHLGRGDATRAALAVGPSRGSGGGDDDDDDDGYGGAAAAVDDAPEARARLLRARNWTSSMTIELGDDDALPAEALSWLRLILAPAATIEPERRCARAREAGIAKEAASCVARVHELFDGPTSVEKEGLRGDGAAQRVAEALAKYDARRSRRTREMMARRAGGRACRRARRSLHAAAEVDAGLDAQPGARRRALGGGAAARCPRRSRRRRRRRSRGGRARAAVVWARDTGCKAFAAARAWSGGVELPAAKSCAHGAEKEAAATLAAPAAAAEDRSARMPTTSCSVPLLGRASRRLGEQGGLRAGRGRRSTGPRASSPAACKRSWRACSCARAWRR